MVNRNVVTTRDYRSAVADLLTLGHSTRRPEAFLELLRHHDAVRAITARRA